MTETDPAAEGRRALDLGKAMTSDDSPRCENPQDQEIITKTHANRAPKLLSRFINKLTKQKVEKIPNPAPTVNNERQWIGTGRRWYDAPYRLLNWLITGRRRNFWPRKARHFFTKCINFLFAFEDYDYLKSKPLDSPMHNLIFPEEENLTQGGLWIVEFFPPSHYANLLRSLRKNGWDKASHTLDTYGSNAEQVTRSRHSAGPSWSRLGLVANSKFPGFFPDAKREALPDEFSSIELTSVQIGRSLTAVVAFIQFNEVGQKSLDSTWRSKKEPTLEWKGIRRPRVESRLFAAFRTTQKERQRIHDLARNWLSRRCGGFFAGSTLGQPVIDFNVFSSFDPLMEDPNSSMRDSLRALGLDVNHLHNYLSPQIPGGIIIPLNSPVLGESVIQNCWGVAGSHDVLSDLINKPGYGKKPYAATTLAAALNVPVRALALHIAVQAYLVEVKKTYATAMDEARSHYGKYSARRLQQLRSALLITSLDLPFVARDTETLWSGNWKFWQGIEIQAIVAPGVLSPKPENYDFIKELGRRRERSFAALLEEDNIYREILSLVSSLGANIEAGKLNRRVLATALITLFIAASTLLVTSPGDSSILFNIVNWVEGL